MLWFSDGPCNPSKEPYAKDTDHTTQMAKYKLVQRLWGESGTNHAVIMNSGWCNMVISDRI